MHNTLRITTTLLFLLFTSYVIAQTGLIRGNIYDKDTGEPMIFCNVFVEGTTLGTTTDLNGFFTISNVPVGTYNLEATFIGYDTARAEVKVKQGGIVYQSLYLIPLCNNFHSDDICLNDVPLHPYYHHIL